MLVVLGSWFGQTFAVHDLAIIGLLVVLEGVLSIDNALVLGLLAKKLPHAQQRRALTYGLVGAFVFRIIAIAMATLLLKWWVVKLIGGGYLLYVSGKHLFFEQPQPHPEGVEVGPDGHPVIRNDTGDVVPRLATAREFWSTVLVIELTDIAFAVDSILAAIALVADQTKTWLVVVGGLLGVILMRFAAIVFIRLLEKFPRFETAAYLLVLVIGGKLVVDWYFNKRPADWPTTQPYDGPANFHSPESPAFWIFWSLMLVCFAVGFIPKSKTRTQFANAQTRPAQHQQGGQPR